MTASKARFMLPFRLWGPSLKFIFLCALVALVCSAPGAAQVAAKPLVTAPTLDDFFADPDIGAARLSPDGRYLAYALAGDNAAVVVMALDDFKAQPILEMPGKGVKIDWLEWKDDNRLVVGATALTINRRGGGPADDIISFRYGKFIFAVADKGITES